MNGGARGFKTRRSAGGSEEVEEDAELGVFAAVIAALYAAKN